MDIITNIISELWAKCFTKSNTEKAKPQSQREILAKQVEHALNHPTTEAMLVFTLHDEDVMHYMLGDFSEQGASGRLLGYLSIPNNINDVVDEVLSQPEFDSSDKRNMFIKSFNSETGHGGVITPDEAFWSMVDRGLGR